MTDETVTLELYEKAIDILTEEIYNDAVNLHPILFEDNWKIMGGNISGLRRSLLEASGPFDDGNPDIRYSVGTKTDKAAQEMVEKENAKLREDVAQLKELLKLQGKETHGTKFTPSSVEAAARYLKKNAGAKGDTKALTKLLTAFYEYIAANKDLTWEDVREQAKPIADWLMDHREHTRSEYAQEVLDQIRGSRVYLDESQMAEAAYRFESYDAYRKSLMGSITLAKDANMSLDSWWHEMSTLYPDVFDASVTASDMPSELADVVSRLRNENSSALEYEHSRRWIEQDLIRDVYDSYWRVNNLHTVADRNKTQVNRLKSQHAQRLNKLKADNRQKVEQLKEQHRADVEMIRNAYRQKIEDQRKEMSAKYQESRKKAVATRHQREAKAVLQKEVLSTIKWITNPGKTDTRCPDFLKEPYAKLLESIDLSSEQVASGGEATNNDLRVQNALRRLAETVDKTATAQSPDPDEQDTHDPIDSGYLDLPGDFSDQLRDIAKGIENLMGYAQGDYVVNAMTAEQISQLIETNPSNRKVEHPQQQQVDLFRLLNFSATKATKPNANNDVIIRNIFDIFAGHTSDMAKLNAFALPILDYMKWLNYRTTSTQVVDGNTQITVYGVRDAMGDAYGSAAYEYVLNLIKDINGKPHDGGLPRFYTKMVHNAKAAMVGGNLRVANLQVTAYPRAGLILSQKSLALGLSKLPQIRKAQKYCGIALWKSFGFYDTDITRTVEDQIKGTKSFREKMIEWSLKGAEIGDALTWGALWNACEYEIAATKQYEVGTEAFNQAVGRKLREVVYATQVVDSVLTRSELMRDKNAKTQELSAFMSEPTMSINIVMDAAFRFDMEKRKTGSAEAAWKKTGKYVARAVGVYLSSQLFAAMVEALWDMIRSDDDDEEKWKQYLEALGRNLVLDVLPFNKIPVVSEITEAAVAVAGKRYYSPDGISSTALTQTVTAYSAITKAIKEGDIDSTYKAITKTLRALSSWSGVAAYNLIRDVTALWNSIIGEIDEDLKIG